MFVLVCFTLLFYFFGMFQQFRIFFQDNGMVFPARIQNEIILIGFTGLTPYIADGMKVYDN